MALSVKEIEYAKPDPKPYKLADGGGLCLLVTTSGGKLWRWRYRYKGIEKMMSFGEFPQVGLKEARELHLGARKLLASGTDPMEDRKARVRDEQREEGLSFENIAHKWWAWWSVGKSSRHAATVMRRLEEDVFPAYGHKFIDAVTSADIRQLMISVQARDARDVAKRIHETTGQIFRYAIAHGIGSRNPASDFKPHDILTNTKSPNFARVDAKDLPELLVKIDDYDGAAITSFGLKLLAYTFVRTSELIEAPWQEFDLEEARWVIPAERMKMDTPHIVPLARQSVEVLRALKLLTGSRRLLFPGANDKTKPMSNNTLLYALYRLGYRGRMTGHGFRGLASTILNESGFDEAHVELQLAHLKRNKVAAAYNHAKHLKQRTVIMQWWADHLDAHLAHGRSAGVDIRQTA